MRSRGAIPTWRAADMLPAATQVDENYDQSEERLEEATDGSDVRVWGNMVAFVERLDDEMFKSLQVIDPHTHEYMSRLKDEPVFLALAQKVLDYLTRTGDVKNVPKVALRLVEHFYFKVRSDGGGLRERAEKKECLSLERGGGGERLGIIFLF